MPRWKFVRSRKPDESRSLQERAAMSSERTERRTSVREHEQTLLKLLDVGDIIDILKYRRTEHWWYAGKLEIEVRSVWDRARGAELTSGLEEVFPIAVNAGIQTNRLNVGSKYCNEVEDCG